MSVPFTASSATPTHACHFPIATPPARAVLATLCILANQRTFHWSIRHCMITTSILQVNKSLIPYIFYFIIYSNVSDESSNNCQLYSSPFSGEHLNFKIKTHFFYPQHRPKQFLHMYLHVNFSDIIYSIEKSPSTRDIFHKLEYF